jgi:hypothetical protein
MLAMAAIAIHNGEMTGGLRDHRTPLAERCNTPQFPNISAADSFDLAGCTRLRLQPYLFILNRFFSPLGWWHE